ncbi:MAG: Uma2 family endonuclease [Gammaproteobacteria bacterium]|nr:Uma2 family endonuclease [Gammaproteobacteria bacterium]MYH86309.1 Uma2 family endonuclease [Gammaproteobacteria bacterium]
MTKSTKTPPEESPRRANYQDVLDAPENLVAEIVDGVLHTHPRPAPLHAYAYATLGVRLGNLFGRGGGNGAVGGWLILLEPELHLGKDILVPDVAGWRRERMPAPPDTAYFTVAPDWVCEILSPSTRALDQGAKRDSYAREGIAHLWFVDPEAQTLEVFELREGHWTLLETATGEAEVSPPPFSGAPFNLGDLWWSSTPEPSEPSSVHEPAVAAQSTAAG